MPQRSGRRTTRDECAPIISGRGRHGSRRRRQYRTRGPSVVALNGRTTNRQPSYRRHYASPGPPGRPPSATLASILAIVVAPTEKAQRLAREQRPDRAAAPSVPVCVPDASSVARRRRRRAFGSARVAVNSAFQPGHCRSQRTRTRKPSLEVAPATLAQRTRSTQTTRNTSRRNVRP